jgi:hypothetical protein
MKRINDVKQDLIQTDTSQNYANTVKILQHSIISQNSADTV